MFAHSHIKISAKVCRVYVGEGTDGIKGILIIVGAKQMERQIVGEPVRQVAVYAELRAKPVASLEHLVTIGGNTCRNGEVAELLNGGKCC